MTTTKKPDGYCLHCGLDMARDEKRMCRDCDGDICTWKSRVKRKAKPKVDLLPPWILFVDKDKPHSILPAGRPGTVLDVRHLTMKEARRIVTCANALRAAVQNAKLRKLKARLVELEALVRAELGPKD